MNSPTSQPLRVLCVTGYYKPAYVYGGPVRSVSELCEGLAQAGADVTVFTSDANGPGQRLDVPKEQPIDVNGVQVTYYPASWPAASLMPFYAPALVKPVSVRLLASMLSISSARGPMPCGRAQGLL